LKEPVIDMVATPDGKAAYLALGFLGLAKLDLASKSVKIVSKTAYVRALALTPDGRRLYVSYQAKGPGGSFGHDAIGYFDTATDRLAGAVTGFANVGESISVSPDGSQVWENGADACDSPQYDHIGCPAVPGGLLNIVTTANNRLARVIGMRGARLQGITFSPDGEYVAVGTTDHLLLIRSTNFAMVASVPVESTGRIAFTADGLKAYSPVNEKSAVAVIQIGVQVRALRLTDRQDRDQTVTLGITPGENYDAKSIDPESLRLEGVGVQRTAEGAPAVSIEGLVGFHGHCLVVHFKMEGAKTASKMTLVGRTYAGMLIRGTVESP
jgi:hypothetical protein